MGESDEMFVIKRNGISEIVSFDKILTRVRNIGQPKKLSVNYTGLVMKIIDQLHDNIHTEKIDELLSEQCASMCTIHYDYYILANEVIISNHEKKVSNYSMTDYVNKLKKSFKADYISDKFHNIVNKYNKEITNMIDYSRNYLIDYFGFKTLERAYLMRIDNEIIENIQHMWMRVAIQIHGDNMDKVKETYDGLSLKKFIHATPTLFNSGTSNPQLSSCFLLGMESDSINGIFNTLNDCAMISKWAGGIGLHIHNIRTNGSHIRGTNGRSHGIVPMLRVYNNTARYCDQGGKRHGSFAIYLEPWHGDIENYLDLRKNHGDEESRARDLFYALWIPDYFMEQVKSNKEWYLMCPDKCPGLSDVYGDEFVELYNKYISEGNYLSKINARDLWFKVLDSQMETGTPYLLYKDAANKKSNQSNIGTLKSSNLCTEILEVSNHEESAVCNLASISLPAFLKEDNTYDYDSLQNIAEILTENLNNIIDGNFYPTIKTKRSNMRHRPIGIGVQGLADLFARMKLPFDSDEAKNINKNIFETIYYGSMKRTTELSIKRNDSMVKLVNLLKKYVMEDSNVINFLYNIVSNEFYSSNYISYNYQIDILYNELKPTSRELFDIEGTKELLSYYEKIKNRPFDSDIVIEPTTIYDLINIHTRNHNYIGSYSSFGGSPLNNGKFQFDLWNVTPSQRYDWESLRENISKYGARNSLCIAPMPTASTSQILGNNECFEPFTSNIYTRRTIAGEFMLTNKHLIKELTDRGIWNNDIKNSIIRDKGSIQNIPEIPEDVKNIFKIVWEIDPTTIIDMARDRGAYICQSQSMNLWVEDPNYKNLTKIHFYGWKQGLKTGIYYLRRKAKHQAQQFTVEPVKSIKNDDTNEEVCEMCSG